MLQEIMTGLIAQSFSFCMFFKDVGILTPQCRQQSSETTLKSDGNDIGTDHLVRTQNFSKN